jgi:hypothetical protein
LTDSAAFYTKNGTEENERKILEEKKLLLRITEDKKDKGKGGKRFSRKYRVKKGQTEEKNILEKGSVPRKKEKIKKLKNFENNVVSLTPRLSDPYNCYRGR